MRATCALVVAVVCARAPIAAGEPERSVASGGSDRSAEVRTDPPSAIETIATETILIEGEAPLGAGATGRHVSAEVIAATPRRSADDLLRMMPGLHLSRHGAEGKGPQIFLRGVDAVHGADVEVTVAGVRVNELSNVHGQGYLDLAFVPAEVIGAVRADKGAYRAEQGPFATAGSVALELAVPERGTRAGYEIGTTNRHRLVGVVAPAGMPDATFAAVEALSDDGFGQNRGSRRLSLIGQTSLHAGGAGEVSITGAASAGRFGEPSPVPLDDYLAGRMGFYDTHSEDTRGDSRRALAAARYRRVTGDGRLEVAGHGQLRRLSLEENFTGFLVDAERGDRLTQRHDAAGGGASARAERRLARWVTAVAGAEATLERIDQVEDRVDAGGAPWRRERGLAGTQAAAAAWAGARLRPHERVRLDLAGRLDGLWFDVTGVAAAGEPERRGRDATWALSPRAALSYAPSPRVGLIAAYGRGLRPPHASAALGAGEGDASGATITAADTVELGARLRLGGGVKLGATAFGLRIARESVFDHAAATTIALEATRRLGAEVAVEYRPVSWLVGRADATVVDARFEEDGRPVPSVPWLLVALELRAEHPAGWRAAGWARYVGPRPLAHGATAGDVAVVDLSGGYRRGRAQLDLVIDNALDSRWREGEYQYASWLDREQPRTGLPRIHYAPGAPLGVRATLTGWF